MNQALLKKFQTAYRALDLFPLVEPEDIEQYRVDYGKRVLAKLKMKVKSAPKDGKFVFAGHRGCGKSTLLKRFAVEMQSDYFVVFFSISDLIEMSAVGHVNVLYSIGLMLLHEASKAKVAIPGDIQKSLLRWVGTSKKETTETGTTGQMAVELDVKVMKGKLQREGKFREELVFTYEKKITELVGYIDRLAAAVQIATKKPVLVVIDDLDKLDLSVVKPLYRENLKALFSPAINIVFTIPIAAAQEADVMGALNSEGVERPELFPVTKFFGWEDSRSPDAAPIEKNVALFERVIEKRLGAELLGEATRRKMVLMSGGVMRELVRLGRECCTEAMLLVEEEEEDVVIDDEILAVAVRNLRNDFARQITPEMYGPLKEVYEQRAPVENAAFSKLLHGLIILEYENDDLWYDLHPIVLNLLTRKKILEPSS